MTTESPAASGSRPTTPRAPLVLFDGACPMCRRVRGADKLQWLDVANEPGALPIGGVDRDTAMARFHVRDVNGRWQTGAYGFAELWAHLRGYRLLSLAVRKLHLLPLIDAAYTRFARWRLRRQCDTGACTVGGSTANKPEGTS